MRSVQLAVFSWQRSGWQETVAGSRSRREAAGCHKPSRGSGANQRATSSRACGISRLEAGRTWLDSTVQTAAVCPSRVTNSTS